MDTTSALEQYELEINALYGLVCAGILPEMDTTTTSPKIPAEHAEYLVEALNNVMAILKPAVAQSQIRYLQDAVVVIERHAASPE